MFSSAGAWTLFVNVTHLQRACVFIAPGILKTRPVTSDSSFGSGIEKNKNTPCHAQSDRA